MQLYGRRVWLNWPLLKQTKLACYSLWDVVLNSVEANERAYHPIQVLVRVAHVADSKGIEIVIVDVWLPSNLQNKP